MHVCCEQDTPRPSTCNYKIVVVYREEVQNENIA